MTEPTDAELIALLGDRQFSSIGAVREALRRWGTPPAVAGEPVACTYGDNGYACCEGGPCQAELHNERIAAPQPTPVRKPLTDAQVRKWWERDNGLEDCNLCKLDDFMKAVRAVEAAHGITKGGQHGAE